MKSRVLVLALSFYVTLDLSLAVMPGAFVFEPDETVESTLSARGRLKAEVASVPVRPGGVLPMWQPRLDRGLHRPAPRASARLRYFAVTCLPRVSCALPQDSEDPH